MRVVVVCVLGGGGRKTGSGKQAVTTEPGQRLEWICGPLTGKTGTGTLRAGTNGRSRTRVRPKWRRWNLLCCFSSALTWQAVKS